MKTVLRPAALTALLVSCPLSGWATETVLAHAPQGSACLEQPGVYEMDFLAFFDTDEQAIRAAAEIDAEVFEIKVRTAAIGPGWVLQAVYRRLPEAAFHTQQADRMVSILTRHGAEPGVGCRYRSSSAPR